MQFHEVNFDGLPGPTHNFAGLGQGNLASTQHAGQRSWPRRAALQSIEKMRLMLKLGLKQGILPPHPRPAIHLLRRLGFHGQDADVVASAAKHDLRLLHAVYSSSAMWVANAATITPSPDSNDGRLHFTPANLSSQFHRSIEARYSARLLKSIFTDPEYFVHHKPLPAAMPDEGAANHTRLGPDYKTSSHHLFVYGRSAFDTQTSSNQFLSRQSLEATRAIARQHGLDSTRTVFAKQTSIAIDSGVFHNDVIAVGNRNLLLVHQHAYEQQADLLRGLGEAMDGSLRVIEVPASRVTLERAVHSYMFNSQLVSPPHNPESQVMIAPSECEHDTVVHNYLDELKQSGQLDSVHYMDLRQSMSNGGGPACLRLRVVLDNAQVTSLSGRVMVTEVLLDEIADWVANHYREHLDPGDLRDPLLVEESHSTLQGLYNILELPYQDPQSSIESSINDS